MSNYGKLYSAVMPDLIKHYDTTEFDYLHNPSYLSVMKVKSHFYNLVLIEIYLEEHRQKNILSIIDLEGIKALHHLVFLKTKWKPSEIKNITHDDLLFVLLDDLIPENLSEPAQKYLETILKGARHLKIELTTYYGWQLASGSQYLRLEQ